MISGDKSCGGEPTKGGSSSAVAMRGDSRPGVLGTGGMHSSGRERLDGPGGVSRHGSSSDALVTEVEDDSGWSW